MRNKKAKFVATLLGAAFLIAGCSGSSEAPEAPAPKEPPVVSVANDTTEYDPAEPVTVKSEGDGLKKVTMTNQDGKEVDGELSSDAKSWTTTEELGYYRTYTVKAEDKNGEVTTSTFSTVEPAETDLAWSTPASGSVVGVAQVVGVRFNNAVANRQAVQDAIKITTAPAVEGAFYWISPSEVRWRPEEFWQPGTKINVDAELYGVEISDGIYAEDNINTEFTIGDKVEAIADDNTKQLEVYKNDELVKTMPISMGTDANPTPNGIYTIGDLYPSLVMDSRTYGLALDAGGYVTPVEYASQMSYSGIYVHAAPWSVGQQGYSNASHGCINVSTANAQWFQETVKRGDPVIVKNTIGETLSGVDGLGDWNIPWETWKAGNVDEV